MDIAGFLPAILALTCIAGLCLGNNGDKNE